MSPYARPYALRTVTRLPAGHPVVPRQRLTGSPYLQQPPLTPALPPAFEAFCALHRDRYLDYARAHLPDGEAHRLVRAVLGDLAVTWPQIVGHPNPAARAWALAGGRVRAARPLPPPLARCPVQQYDALVLHCLLGHSSGDTAAVMGLEPSKIRYLVCSAPAACRRAVRQLEPAPADAG